MEKARRYRDTFLATWNVAPVAVVSGVAWAFVLHAALLRLVVF